MSMYGVHKVCWRLLHDSEFRSAVLADAPAALTDADHLEPDEVTLLLAGEVGELYRRGANSYLLANTMRVGAFGLTKDLYVERVQSAARAMSEIT